LHKILLVKADAGLETSSALRTRRTCIPGPWGN